MYRIWSSCDRLVQIDVGASTFVVIRVLGKTALDPHRKGRPYFKSAESFIDNDQVLEEAG
jgi:hypothetical protein